jgi:hypothetical protein
MRGLLVIDENSQEVEISSYEISLGKYKEYDAVIVVSTVGAASSVAAGVRRPSVKGVTSPKAESIVLKDIDEGGLLAKKRAIAGTELHEGPPFSGWVVGEAEVVKTKWRLHSDVDLLNQSISELALLESQLVGKGEKLYIENEPQVVFDKENTKFRIKETAHVVKPAAPSEGEEDGGEAAIAEELS